MRSARLHTIGRHRPDFVVMLSENVSNSDTPNFKPRDLTDELLVFAVRNEPQMIHALTLLVPLHLGAQHQQDRKDR
jgi:flagellar basal body rod protein FlgB